MIDSNDLLRMKVPLIDTENRKKFILPLRYGKTDLKPVCSSSDISLWEAFCKDFCKNCDHNNCEQRSRVDEEEDSVIDSIGFPVSVKKE